jgi:hypothetical protein
MGRDKKREGEERRKKKKESHKLSKFGETQPGIARRIANKNSH